jgi:hypothetical protein
MMNDYRDELQSNEKDPERKRRQRAGVGPRAE